MTDNKIMIRTSQNKHVHTLSGKEDLGGEQKITDSIKFSTAQFFHWSKIDKQSTTLGIFEFVPKFQGKILKESETLRIMYTLE